MKRILFVDDEPRVLQGLRNMLRKQRRKWHMAFVGSGAEALRALEKYDFDVVVTDMRMPKMDGAELLARAHVEHPATARIVLSGHTEAEAAMRAVPVAHQFLSKPCKATVLENVVERACNLHTLIGDTVIQAKLAEIDKLPSEPRIYRELMRVLGDPMSDADDVAGVLKKDMAMCAKLLQLVNSAFFASAMTISKIETAVARVGCEMVRNLVLSLEVFESPALPAVAGFSLSELHKQAMLTALIAQRLVGDRRQADHAFMSGLLHDVGQLVLAMSFSDRWAAAIDRAKVAQEPLFVAEQRELAVTHMEIGAYLLGLWGLPYPVVEAVGNHHRPSRVETCTELDVLAATHIASVLADELCARPEGNAAATLDEGFVDRIGASTQLPQWRKMAAEIAGEERAT